MDLQSQSGEARVQRMQRARTRRKNLQPNLAKQRLIPKSLLMPRKRHHQMAKRSAKMQSLLKEATSPRKTRKLQTIRIPTPILFPQQSLPTRRKRKKTTSRNVTVPEATTPARVPRIKRTKNQVEKRRQRTPSRRLSRSRPRKSERIEHEVKTTTVRTSTLRRIERQKRRMRIPMRSPGDPGPSPGKTETSLDTSPEAGLETSLETSLETDPETSPETSPETDPEPTEASPGEIETSLGTGVISRGIDAMTRMVGMTDVAEATGIATTAGIVIVVTTVAMTVVIEVIGAEEEAGEIETIVVTGIVAATVDTMIDAMIVIDATIGVVGMAIVTTAAVVAVVAAAVAVVVVVAVAVASTTAEIVKATDEGVRDEMIGEDLGIAETVTMAEAVAMEGVETAEIGAGREKTKVTERGPRRGAAVPVPNPKRPRAEKPSLAPRVAKAAAQVRVVAAAPAPAHQQRGSRPRLAAQQWSFRTTSQ
mmetsp:Transcript_8591/g.18735  ORF Transcript_8591/g.18735 Transcript_8591/m.18735 type:complete len:478 (-) Transcript_8591:437-1870(-)